MMIRTKVTEIPIAAFRHFMQMAAILKNGRHVGILSG